MRVVSPTRGHNGELNEYGTEARDESLDSLPHSGSRRVRPRPVFRLTSKFGLNPKKASVKHRALTMNVANGTRDLDSVYVLLLPRHPAMESSRAGHMV